MSESKVAGMLDGDAVVRPQVVGLAHVRLAVVGVARGSPLFSVGVAVVERRVVGLLVGAAVVGLPVVGLTVVGLAVVGLSL